MKIKIINPDNFTQVYDQLVKLAQDNYFVDFHEWNKNEPDNNHFGTSVSRVEIVDEKIVISPDLYPHRISIGDTIHLKDGKLTHFYSNGKNRWDGRIRTAYFVNAALAKFAPPPGCHVR